MVKPKQHQPQDEPYHREKSNRLAQVLNAIPSMIGRWYDGKELPRNPESHLCPILAFPY